MQSVGKRSPSYHIWAGTVLRAGLTVEARPGPAPGSSPFSVGVGPTLSDGRGASGCPFAGSQRGRVLSVAGELLLGAKLSRGSPDQFVGGEGAQIGFLHVLDAQQKFELLHWFSDVSREPRGIPWEPVRNPTDPPGDSDVG